MHLSDQCNQQNATSSKNCTVKTNIHSKQIPVKPPSSRSAAKFRNQTNLAHSFSSSRSAPSLPIVCELARSQRHIRKCSRSEMHSFRQLAHGLLRSISERLTQRFQTFSYTRDRYARLFDGYDTMRSFVNQASQKDVMNFISDCLDCDAQLVGGDQQMRPDDELTRRMHRIKASFACYRTLYCRYEYGGVSQLPFIRQLHLLKYLHTLKWYLPPHKTWSPS